MVEPGVGDRFRRRFGRRTTSGNFIPEIDGLRFPAIAFVVFGHLVAFFMSRPDASGAASPNVLLAIQNHATEGVVLFFMISGFILAMPFARAGLRGAPSVPLGAYYLRRVTRLEPPYLISLFVFLLLKIAGRRFHLVPGTETASELVTHFAASAVYLHNLIYGVPSIINGVAWSLEIEIQFYVIVPVLALVFRVQRTALRRAIILGLALIVMAVQQRFILEPGRLSFSLVGSLQFFLFGFLLADLYIVDDISAGARSIGWDVAALIAWWAVLATWSDSPAFPVFTPFAALVAFVGVFRGRLFNTLFTNPWITTFGGMCYSIYLLHFMLLSIAGKMLFRWVQPSGSDITDLVRYGPLLLVFAIGVSMLFYLTVELPCMDRTWPRRVHARARSMWQAAPVP